MKQTGINYVLIRGKLLEIEKKYCEQLLSEGTVNTCDDTIPTGLQVSQCELEGGSHLYLQTKISDSSCISKCFDDRYCLAVTYKFKESTCLFHGGGAELRVRCSNTNDRKMIIFPTRIMYLKQDLAVMEREMGVRSE